MIRRWFRALVDSLRQALPCGDEVIDALVDECLRRVAAPSGAQPPKETL